MTADQVVMAYTAQHGVAPTADYVAKMAKITPKEAKWRIDTSSVSIAPKSRKVDPMGKMHLSTTAIKWFFLIIGVCCAISSGLMVFKTLYTIYKFGEFQSIIITIILAGLSVAMPQAFVLSLRQFRKKSVLCILSGIISILTAIIMVNITASNIYSTKIESGITAESIQPKIDLQKSIIESAKNNQETDRRERVQLIADQAGFKPGAEQYERLRNNLFVNQERINHATFLIDSANKKIAELQDSITANTGIVHGLTESIINYGLAGTLEFSGPICLALAMFL